MKNYQLNTYEYIQKNVFLNLRTDKLRDRVINKIYRLI